MIQNNFSVVDSLEVKQSIIAQIQKIINKTIRNNMNKTIQIGKNKNGKTNAETSTTQNHDIKFNI